MSVQRQIRLRPGLDGPLGTIHTAEDTGSGRTQSESTPGTQVLEKEGPGLTGPVVQIEHCTSRRSAVFVQHSVS